MTRTPLEDETNRQHARQLRAELLVGIAVLATLLNILAAQLGLPAPVVWFLGFGLGVTGTAAFVALLLTRRR